MYRVIASFIDLKDGEHPYSVGDAFPREGHTVSEERIKELAGNKNKRKTPLIERVMEPAKKPDTATVSEAIPKTAPVAAAPKEKNDRSGSASNAKSKPRKKK